MAWAATSGVAIVEVFELDQPGTPLINIATRGPVQTGDNVMIAGLIIQGDAPQTVLITARGPSMAGPPHNVPGTLSDPVLTLFSGQTPIASNDNWPQAANAAQIQTAIGAPSEHAGVGHFDYLAAWGLYGDCEWGQQCHRVGDCGGVCAVGNDD
jgi:hypothetical protein